MYKGKLAREWIDWVEQADPAGGREKEIFPLIRSWLIEERPRVLVDVGCGQGDCCRLVSPKIKYFGIEPSKELLARAKKIYKHKNRQFLLGTAENIPLDSSSVDALMSIWVWSHLENLESASAEIFRVLKPDGKFMIVTANPDTYEERKMFYSSYEEFGGYLVGDFDLGGGKKLSNTTLYLHTREYMKKSVIGAGLTVDEITTNGFKDVYPKGLNIVFRGGKKKSSKIVP